MYVNMMSTDLYQPIQLSEDTYYDRRNKRSVSELALTVVSEDGKGDNHGSSSYNCNSNNSHLNSEAHLDVSTPSRFSYPTISAVTPPRRSVSGNVKLSSISRNKSFDDDVFCKNKINEGVSEGDLSNEYTPDGEQSAKSTSRLPRPLSKILNAKNHSHYWNAHSKGFRRIDSLDSPRIRSNTNISLSVTDDGDEPKTRRISTPEMVNRRQLFRRKSLESLGHLRAVRASVNARNKSSPAQQHDTTSHGSDEVKISYHQASPNPSRPRTISNLWRKISISTKTLNRRSLHLPLDRTSSNGSTKYRSQQNLDDRDVIVNERDHALEEWSESAKKCEELIDELDRTLSELMSVKSDRDHKQSELDRLLTFYETDMDDRDMEIEELQTKIIELNEVQAVLRAERDEAFDQRDEQLQKTYHISQEMNEMRTEIDETVQENEKMKEKYQTLYEQLDNLQDENQEKLKKPELTMLILDSPLPDLTVTTKITDTPAINLMTVYRNGNYDDNNDGDNKAEVENVEMLKTERDKLKEELSRIKKLLSVSSKNKHLSISMNNDDSWYDDSLKSTCPINEYPPTITVSESDPNFPEITLSNGDVHNHDKTPDTSTDIEQEDIAICIDTLDSRTGLKFDNAFDEPRVMVTEVTKQLEEKWNIKKHDRIVSVNGVSVQHADKKVVDRLIKDTVGRTISLVLRRENLQSGNKNFSDIEISLGKQCDIGLKFSLCVHSIDDSHEELPPGLENINNGDVITKKYATVAFNIESNKQHLRKLINSQDINSILSILMKKLAKKSNNKLTLRLKKNGVGDLNDTVDTSKKPPSITPSRSFSNNISSFIRPRKMSATLSTDSSRHVLSDISSLFSFTSTRGEENQNKLNTSKVPPVTRASFHGFSSSHRVPPPRLVKQKALRVPAISVDNHLNNDEENIKRPYSPERSNSFESFTQIFMDDSTNKKSDRTRKFLVGGGSNANSTLNIAPPRRHSLYRPSPRLRHIDDDSSGSERGNRQSKSKSLYLEVLNRRSFAASISLSDNENPNQQQQQSKRTMSVDSVKSQSSFRNISGYATLPRRYKRKSSKRQRTTKTVRLHKGEDDSIGFKICGGNKIGIFVSEIVTGSVAAASNLKVGDKLLHFNSLDLTRATLDFATRVLLNNQKSLKIRIQVEENEDYLDLLQNPYLESLYVRTLHSYNATNLNEMSFKASDILHITDTRYNFDETNMAWTWYGVRKVSSSKQTEGEIPAIEGFAGTKETSEKESNINCTNKSRLRKLSKSAQDLKRWLSKKPSIRRKKSLPKLERSASTTEQSKRLSFYEILLEEPIIRL